MGGLRKEKRYPAQAHLASVAEYLPEERRSNYIFLVGGRSIPIGTSDQFYPFIQDSFFYYCSGLAQPDAFLLYDIAARTITLFIAPLRTGRDIAYLGQRPTLHEVSLLTDAHTIRYADAALIAALLSVDAGLYYSIADETLLRAMVMARSIKSRYEIHALREASRITSLAHAAVARALKGAQSEQALERVFTATCAAHGAGTGGGLEFSYAPIVAARRHAAVLHYTAPRGGITPLSDDDDDEEEAMVLMDAAASWRGYASDITRTFPRHGTFRGRAREVYALVLEMQDASMARVRPGIRMSEVGDASHEVLLRKMVEWKWVECDVDQARQLGLSRAFLMHGIGHHVGLDVHDVTPQSDKAQAIRAMAEEALRVGNVVTVEPGVYFNEEFLETFFESDVGRYFNKEVIQEWTHVGGVRIEDVLLVTEDGYELLSHVPRTVKDVEALCQSQM